MLRALAIFPFTSCLLAQGAPDPLRYVPPDAVFVLRSKGPAALRTELGGTGVGRALASQAVADAAKGLGEFLLTDLDLGDEMSLRLEKLWTAIGGHEGAIVVGASVTLPLPEGRQIPHFVVSLAAFGDGHTDLQAVAAALRGMLPPDEGRAQTLGGIDLRVHRFDDVAVTEPVVHDGAVLMFCSDDLETAVPACVGEHPTPFPAAPELLRGAIGMQFEFQGLLPGVLEMIAREEGPGALVDMLPKLVEELGLEAMQRVAATVYADGAQIVQEGMLEFGDGPRGVFDVFLPVRQTAPTLLRYLPSGAASFTLSSFDLEALHRLYVQMFAAHGEALPMTREEVEQKFTEFTKLRLYEDLLALVGDELLGIEDLAAQIAAGEEDDPRLDRVMSEYGETCYVVRLRDGATFAANLEKMVRARGLHAGRKSEEYGGVRVYRLKLLGTVPIEYAVAGDAFVLGVGGAGSQRNLRGVLDAIAAHGRGETPAGLPKGLQARLAALPPDFTHLSAGALGEALDGMVEVFEGIAATLAAEDMTLEDLDGAWHLVLPAVKALRADLKRFDADVSVTTGYSTKGKSMFRSRW
jgi:hypothetical protein